MRLMSKSLLTLSLAAMLYAPAFAQSASTARPGTVNYVEGDVSIGGAPLTAQSIGSAELNPGQAIETGHGKVEILLTPGVFFRLNDNSVARMITPGLTDTQIALEKGSATVEVADLYKQNDIQVIEDGIHTRLLKDGLYQFDASKGNVLVFKGKAAVVEGNGQIVDVKGHHELAVNAGEPVKPDDFDAKAAEGDLYQWSSLRSSYLAEANTDAAMNYIGAQHFYTGWYWDPYFASYTFIPGDGMYMSPFGWGYYSPWWIGSYGGGYYGRYGARPYRNFAGYRGYVGAHGYTARPMASAHMASPAMGGFRSGGGFAGGGGGFHGGGGGGHR